MMYSKGYQAADKDHQSAYATQQTAEENYRKCVSEPTVEDALSCYQDTYNTDREQERAEQDLDAQREMANWAEGMLWATLFIGSFTAAITALGVVYVAKTLSATAQTLEAANRTNDIMRADQRPWLKPIPRVNQLSFDGDKLNIEIVVALENGGKSPATDVNLYILTEITNQPWGAVNEQQIFRAFLAESEFPTKEPADHNPRNGPVVFASQTSEFPWNVRHTGWLASKNPPTFSSGEHHGGTKDAVVINIRVSVYYSYGDERFCSKGLYHTIGKHPLTGIWLPFITPIASGEISPERIATKLYYQREFMG